MFSTPSELKEFILWAKEQKVSEVHVGDVKFLLSPLAFEITPAEFSKKEEFETTQPEKSIYEDEDLYFSSSLKPMGN